jgi:short-subunit dehydrogenase
LATPEGVEALHKAIVKTGRPVAAIAINAGVGVGGKFFETGLKEELNVINLNIISVVHLTKLIVKDMIARGESGKILYTSSIAATMPGPYLSVYSASKAFVQSFAESMRYELKEKGILVTAMQPGPTDTNFFERAHMEDTKVGAQEKDDPADVAKQGYDALMEGKEKVIVGSLKTRLTNAANDLIPEQIKAKMHGDMAKPGSAAGVASRK